MNQKRVVIYLNEEDYKNFRAVLIIQGLTVSSWFREAIKKELKKQDPQAVFNKIMENNN